MKTFFKEFLHKGLKQEITIDKTLVDKNSNTEIQIFDTVIYGRILVLDGIKYRLRKDEAAYSEMLVRQLTGFKPKKF